MPEFENITLEVDAGVATLTLNRPERLNAFTTEMAHEILAAFDHIDADDDIRAVVVTGAGRGFCAGADLSEGADAFNAVARGVAPRDGRARRDTGGRGVGDDIDQQVGPGVGLSSDGVAARTVPSAGTTCGSELA